MYIHRDIHREMFFLPKLSEVQAFVPAMLDSQGSAPGQLQKQPPGLLAWGDVKIIQHNPLPFQTELSCVISHLLGSKDVYKDCFHGSAATREFLK